MAENRITYLGGSAEGIGPSAYLLTIHGHTVMLDFGLEFVDWPKNTHTITRAFFRKKVQGSQVWKQILGEKKIDAVLVSHDHLDHSGGVPQLAEHLSPRARVWAHPVTNEGLWIVFQDTLKYSPYIADIFETHEILNRRKNLALGENEILPGVKVFVKLAGHLPGAVCFIFDFGNGERVLFANDMCRHDQPMVPGAKLCSEDVPENWMPTQIAGTDATYGNEVRRDWDAECSRLVEESEKIITAGGKVNVAAFGFGRGQNIAFEFMKRGFTVYIDGVIRRVLELYERTLNFNVDRSLIRFVENSSHRDDLIESDNPIIVITTAGMADAGPIIPYMIRSLPRKKDAVFFTSWVAPDSKAARILERSAPAQGVGTILLPEEEHSEKTVSVPIRARIDRFWLSSHLDGKEMREYCQDIVKKNGKKLKRICVTHGTPEAKRALALAVADLADDTIIIEPGTTIKI